MNAVVTLISPFVGIVAHRVGPDVLPASRFLLGLVLALHLVVYTFDLWVLETAAPRLFALPIIDAGAQGVFFAVLLATMGLPERLLQTLTAAYGAELVLEIVYLPIALAMNTGAETPIAALGSFAALGLLLLSLAVKGHILHRATGLPYFVGVTIALGLSLALIALDDTLFASA